MGKLSVFKTVIVIAIAFISGCANSVPARLSSASIQKSVEFNLPQPIRWTLPNGLSVLYLHNPELPLVSGTLYLRAGSLWEPPTHTFVGSAMGQLLREGGAGDLSADVMDEELEKLSAGIGSSLSGEFGSVSFSCLTQDFNRVFGLFSDVILRPRFETSRIDLWKSQSIEEIRRRVDDPWTVAGITFNQILYEGTQYGLVSLEEDIQSLSREKILDLHHMFVRPDGALLVITGDISREAVEGIVTLNLGGWESRGHGLGPFPPVDNEPQPGIYFIPLPLSQSTVYLGHQGVPRLTPDHIAIESFNQLFGSGFFGSRLTKKIRTELGLAYGIFGAVVPGPVKGKNLIAFQTKSESTGKALTTSLQELIYLKQQAPSIVELNDVQRAVTNSFIFKFDTPEDAINRRATIELLGYPPDYDETYLSKVAALTPDAIQEVAKSRWNLNEFVIVVAGNETAYSSLEEVLKNPPEFLKGMKMTRIKFDQEAIF